MQLMLSQKLSIGSKINAGDNIGRKCGESTWWYVGVVFLMGRMIDDCTFRVCDTNIITCK